MRPKPILVLTLVVLALAAGGCHKKGGGYLAPTPVNHAVSR